MRLIPLPGSGGRLLAAPEDFRVDEILAYPLCGEGEHLFLRIRKTNLTTDEAIRRLGFTQAGVAGLKDKAAVASQWISIPHPIAAPMPSLAGADGVEVLEARRHKNKLRRGHQRGNRFTIVVREVPPGGTDRAQAILSALRETGVPNAFGPQRFGIHGDNADRALAFIRKEARPPKDRRRRDLLISALQSRVFNRILRTRIERGLFDRALLGDVMTKHASGGMFTVVDPVQETERVKALEISPTGLLPGRKQKPAAGEAGALEVEAMEVEGLRPTDVQKMSVGTRRALRFPLDPDARIEPVGEDAYMLEVTLPSGAYATVLLDELIKPEGGPLTRTLS